MKNEKTFLPACALRRKSKGWSCYGFFAGQEKPKLYGSHQEPEESLNQSKKSAQESQLALMADPTDSEVDSKLNLSAGKLHPIRPLAELHWGQ